VIIRNKILWICLIAVAAAVIPLAFVACTSTTAPEEVDAPPSTGPSASLLERVPRITIDELLQKMADNGNILIVDTRHAEEYEVDHIKGAISVPLDTITSGGWMPPADKEVIFYCG
jgi:3-mercaptopyruvate sulfurtransferase SseA